ncbi:MAG: ABC transporter substrate-binding protein [Smithellaceae bacterium]|nr:ABC transporter substrate-binding protein [Smithellaceae bacterium]
MEDLTRREILFKGAGLALVTLGGALALPGGAGAIKQNEATKKMTVIKLGYLPLTDHLTIIALARMNFREVQVEPIKFSSWKDLAAALKGGAVDAAFALTPIGLELRRNQAPIKAILLGHRNGSVVTVKIGEEIKSVADLAGKKIAVPSRFSTHNILIRKILDDRKIDPSKVELLEMAPPEMVQSLASGQIQAFIVAEPFGAQAEMQKVGRVLILSKDIWPNHICCVLNIHEQFIKDNRTAVQELVDGLVDAGGFITREPQQAAKLSLGYLGQRPEVIAHVLTTPRDRVTFDQLFPTREDFAVTQSLMTRFKIAEGTVNLDEYIDPSFARKAYKL